MNREILPSNFPFLTSVILQSRILWSIRLRWIAVAGYFTATFIASRVTPLSLPYDKIWAALYLLAGINILYYVILKLFKDFSVVAELIVMAIHIVVDLLFLTIIIHFSGGVENPVYFFYVFHVVISSIVFPRWIPYIFATLVVLFFSAVVYAEASLGLSHYCIFDETMHQNDTILILVLVIFTITVYVTAYICTTFMRIYRESKRIIDKQNLKLIESDKQKTQFFRFASHELKAPIVAIKTSVDGVLKSFGDKMDPKAVNLLQRASDRARQMLEIIKELLELSRQRTLINEKQKKPVAIQDLLQEIYEQELPLAENKKIILEFRIDSNEIHLYGVKEDFSRIFLNLVNNAIRYTPEGGKVTVTATGENKQFELRVSDTGIGIAEEDREKIFSEFYRSEQARNMVHYGTGLGLSLVKKIVEDYGGKIEVESRVGEGSTFIVRLPVKPAK
ncbi:MAG TPA: HAMP domain-containing histidine kinase [Calditrichaeota bacterium]|nr:HAMP domain-containing histidine kinase [Calditrichota bacterium]